MTPPRVTSVPAGSAARVASCPLTYKFHDTPAAAPAAGLLPCGRQLRQAAGCGQGLQELWGRGPEELLQELQGASHHIVVLVLRVMQGQLVHLETESTRGTAGLSVYSGSLLSF